MESVLGEPSAPWNPRRTPYDPMPTGRRGHYWCPFCKYITLLETEMIVHRRESQECILQNEVLRAGAMPDVLPDTIETPAPPPTNQPRSRRHRSDPQPK